MAENLLRPQPAVRSISIRVSLMHAQIVGKSLPFGTSKGIRKMVSGHIGVGKKMKEWKFQEHDACPRCGAPAEDSQHVLQCSPVSDFYL